MFKTCICFKCFLWIAIYFGMCVVVFLDVFVMHAMFPLEVFSRFVVVLPLGFVALY